MQQRSAQFRPHPLPQAQLPQRRAHQVAQLQGLCQLSQACPVILRGNPVYILQQVIAVPDRYVPPQLGPLAENHADLPHMLFPLLPGNTAAHRHLSAVRRQDPGKDFDRGGFPGAVGPDISQQFPLIHVKGNLLQRPNRLFLPQQRAFFPLFPDNKPLLQIPHANVAHKSFFHLNISSLLTIRTEGARGQRRQWRLCWKGRKALALFSIYILI